MSTWNPNQHAPNPYPAGDRRTNVAEGKVGQNEERRGRQRAWEYTGQFYDSDAGEAALAARLGANSSPRPVVGHPSRGNRATLAPIPDLTERPGTVYNRQLAPGRGPVGSGARMEHWTDEPEYLAAFAQGTGGEPGEAAPYAFRTRPHAVGLPVTNWKTPLDGLAQGERVNTQYGVKAALEGGGRWHRNDAEVTD
jgi:hypothetical protein